MSEGSETPQPKPKNDMITIREGHKTYRHSRIPDIERRLIDTKTPTSIDKTPQASAPENPLKNQAMDIISAIPKGDRIGVRKELAKLSLTEDQIKILIAGSGRTDLY